MFKKRFLIFTLLIFIIGCTDAGKEREFHNDINEATKFEIIFSDGETLQTRIRTPENYERRNAEDGTITCFLRNYAMKDDLSPVLLYNGSEKGNQNAHEAVFELPIENEDLQQCADSVMRVFAEYYWSLGQYDRIKFYFTDGFLCEYSKWIEGYRVSFDGGTKWVKRASYDTSYETFLKYLRIVFSYAGTASMQSYETETISLTEMSVGDVILEGGSPGHVVMVVDECVNEKGEKAYLFAQGYMPAQEFHIIKNPMHSEDPWYYEEEMSFPLKTAEYTFNEVSMIKRLIY